MAEEIGVSKTVIEVVQLGGASNITLQCNSLNYDTGRMKTRFVQIARFQHKFAKGALIHHIIAIKGVSIPSISMARRRAFY